MVFDSSALFLKKRNLLVLPAASYAVENEKTKLWDEASSRPPCIILYNIQHSTRDHATHKNERQRKNDEH